MPGLHEVLASLAATAADAAFPPRCAACGALADLRASRGFCRTCLAKLPLRPPGETWLACLDRPWPGDPIPDMRAVCACLYRDPIRNALLDLKFHESAHLAEALGGLVADAARRVCAERGFRWDAVAAVPLHATRLRERGYNQAALVARPVARALGLPDVSAALARTRATEIQSLMETPETRRANLHGAFAVLAPERVRGRRLLLVDDVLTTGTTLHACALSVHAAGAAGVDGAVVASGRRTADGRIDRGPWTNPWK